MFGELLVLIEDVMEPQKNFAIKDLTVYGTPIILHRNVLPLLLARLSQELPTQLAKFIETPNLKPVVGPSALIVLTQLLRH